MTQSIPQLMLLQLSNYFVSAPQSLAGACIGFIAPQSLAGACAGFKALPPESVAEACSRIIAPPLKA